MNCNLLKFCLIPLLLVFFNSYSFAQKSNAVKIDSAVAPVEEDFANSDSENVADTLIVRTAFESTGDSMLKLKRSREFGYMAYLDSLLRKKRDLRVDTVSIDKGTVNRSRRTIESSSDINSKSFLNSFPVKIFFWTLAIFFIGFILYKLFLTGGLFSKGSAKTDDGPASKEPEFLDQYSEYDILIRAAEMKNDFNLGIRYLYLQSLKKLSDNELITFSADKTNNLYVGELAGRSYQQDFAFLTLNYEYIWYGRFEIDSTRYQKLKNGFILFNKKV